jgi:hypothetical protein
VISFSVGSLTVGKGILEFIDNHECAICMETKRCVSQPKCNHFICIDCFKNDSRILQVNIDQHFEQRKLKY